MGDIPGSRLTPARPFTNCGVEYFGPLHIRGGFRRNAKTIKGYGVIFICFATKAVHLELVRDLTTSAFINTLKRFMARRGKPSNIYSDNATNLIHDFVGDRLKMASTLWTPLVYVIRHGRYCFV